MGRGKQVWVAPKPQTEVTCCVNLEGQRPASQKKGADETFETPAVLNSLLSLKILDRMHQLCK